MYLRRVGLIATKGVVRLSLAKVIPVLYGMETNFISLISSIKGDNIFEILKQRKTVFPRKTIACSYVHVLMRTQKGVCVSMHMKLCVIVNRCAKNNSMMSLRSNSTSFLDLTTQIINCFCEFFSSNCSVINHM